MLLVVVVDIGREMLTKIRHSNATKKAQFTIMLDATAWKHHFPKQELLLQDGLKCHDIFTYIFCRSNYNALSSLLSVAWHKERWHAGS
jgi:hypothetical protein